MSNYSLDFSGDEDFRPLAARMRPQTVEQYIGQQHILGPGKPLRRALEAGHIHSMILWGPPGTGKTTLAEVAANYANAEVERVSAVTSGVKEIRAAIEKARENKLSGRRTILFVDEVHRFNKSQQDAFLPHIEDGTVTFIGATTENPSFELNNALLSRARVYKLTSLNQQEILQALHQAIADTERGLGKVAAVFADNVLDRLAELVNGDARMSLNYLELLYDMAREDDQGRKQIDLPLLAEVAGEKVSRFDNKGDIWYDLISAVHKSIRGSDPDAALYWAARMISAGCDLCISRAVCSRLPLKMLVMPTHGACKWHSQRGIALPVWGLQKASARLLKRLSTSPAHRKATRCTPRGNKRCRMRIICLSLKYRRICVMPQRD